MLVLRDDTPGNHENSNSSVHSHPMGDCAKAGSEIPGALGELQAPAVLDNQCYLVIVGEKRRFLAAHFFQPATWEMGYSIG